MLNSITQYEEDHMEFEIPLWVIILGALSPLLVLLVAEIVKKQEIM